MHSLHIQSNYNLVHTQFCPFSKSGNPSFFHPELDKNVLCWEHINSQIWSQFQIKTLGLFCPWCKSGFRKPCKLLGSPKAVIGQLSTANKASDSRHIIFVQALRLKGFLYSCFSFSSKTSFFFTTLTCYYTGSKILFIVYIYWLMIDEIRASKKKKLSTSTGTVAVSTNWVL